MIEPSTMSNVHWSMIGLDLEWAGGGHAKFCKPERIQSVNPDTNMRENIHRPENDEISVSETEQSSQIMTFKLRRKFVSFSFFHMHTSTLCPPILVGNHFFVASQLMGCINTARYPAAGHCLCLKTSFQRAVSAL